MCRNEAHGQNEPIKARSTILVLSVMIVYALLIPCPEPSLGYCLFLKVETATDIQASNHDHQYAGGHDSVTNHSFSAIDCFLLVIVYFCG